MSIIGTVLIVFGLLNIFAKDFIWALTELGNRLEGQVSERTGTWDAGATVVGVLMVLFGLFLLFNG